MVVELGPASHAALRQAIEDEEAVSVSTVSVSADPSSDALRLREAVACCQQATTRVALLRWALSAPAAEPPKTLAALRAARLTAPAGRPAKKAKTSR